MKEVVCFVCGGPVPAGAVVVLINRDKEPICTRCESTDLGRVLIEHQRVPNNHVQELPKQ